MIHRALSLAALLATIAATNAPADRYFGRLQMSTLRIRYETMQLRKRYESHELYPDQAQHLLDLTANAFYAWAGAYPHDAWLPSTGLLLAQLYADLPGGVARVRAVALFTYVKSHFSTTRYGAQSRAILHRGVPIKPIPVWARAPVSGGGGVPSSEAPSPAPSAALTTTPSPAKTP